MSRKLTLCRRIVGVSLGLMLPACGDYGPRMSPVSMSAASKTVQSRSGRSWMKSSSSGQDLLYVADQTTQDVYVYTYPQGQLVRTLTGFINPTGECVDSGGDVFIVSQESTSPKFIQSRL